jgi:hypothetical protein
MALALANSQAVNNGTASDTTSLSTASVTRTVGNIIVVKGATEDAAQHLGTPTGGGVTTWTKWVEDTTAGHTYCVIWTGVVTSGGSAVVTMSWGTGTGGRHSIVANEWSGAALATTPNTCSARGTGSSSVTISGAVSTSVADYVQGDWAAVTGARTYISSATEDGNHDPNNGSYVAHYAHQANATNPCGMTAPTGQTYNLLGIEILDASAGTAAATPAPFVSRAAVQRASSW